ncbi:MAG TPA: hypothetical protein VFC63_09760 [Blastocatellia bacterium]|nr:hypothetical protein [Blastocatellia bacterium]
MKRIGLAKAIAVVLILLAPIITDSLLMHRYNYYQELLRQYECYPQSPRNLWYLKRNECIGDFDGDGANGSVVLNLDHVQDAITGKIVIKDGGRDLFHLGYVYQSEPDEMVLLAIYREGSNAHLIVLDEVTQQTPLAAVFGWDGRQIAQMQPSAMEREILAALRAQYGQAESGSWFQFRMFRKPLLFLYYAGFLVVWLARRSRVIGRLWQELNAVPKV